MAVALGTDSSKEAALNLSLLTPHLTGSVGLLFTPRSPAEILSYFSSFTPLDFARAGTTATRTFTLPAGTVYSCGGEIPIEDDTPLAHGIEPTLRKLGVPSKLVKGRVELENEYVVCREGEVLGSGQTTLLKMFGVVTAEFKVALRAYWSAAKEEVVDLGAGEGGGGEGMDVEEGQ